MKVKSSLSVMTMIIVFTFLLVNAFAQNTSPFWSLAGNSNASSTSKLGTTNNISLRLHTNNLVRVFINGGNGNVGIGTGNTANASYKLYVKGVGYGVYGSGSNYGIVGSGGSYGVYGYGTTAGLYGVGGTYGVYSSGVYGIYATGSSYGTYGYSTDGYGGVSVSYNGDGHDATTTNGYYGLYASSGYYIGSYGYGPSYGHYGYSSAGTGVRGASYSGVGTYGSSTDYYGGYFYSSNSYGIRAATNAGFYAGVFDGAVWTSAAYYTSDKNLKKNIKDVGDAMSIIRQLKPKNYEFKDEAKFKSLSLPKGTHFGLLAQDVEKVLPNLVHEEKRELDIPEAVAITPEMHGKKGLENLAKGLPSEAKEVMNIKAVNYDELIPILIKALQEQDEKISALNAQVEKLQGRTTTGTTGAFISGATIEQNIPNPATNSTSIRYNNIPQGASAVIAINNNQGKIMKQIVITGNTNGMVALDVASMISGTYTYSLLVDGKLIDTKKMELVR